MFQVEHREHLAAIRSSLDLLRGEGVSGRPELDEAFRRAHSLKGAARAVDLATIETLAHRLEALFARMREGVVTLDGPVRAIVNDVLDAIEDWVAGHAEGRAQPDPSGARTAIEQLLEIEPEPATVTPGDGAGPSPVAFGPSPGTVRVRVDSLDRLLLASGSLFSESERQNRLSRELASLGRLVSSLERSMAGAPRAMQETGAEDRFWRRWEEGERKVRELSRAMRALVSEQRQGAWSLLASAGQLDEELRRVRLVPVESLFEGFRKMVRDLARDVGKAVEVHAKGLEVEVDRSVLEALRDPIMHLLRNAVDHGIEAPPERERRGKSPAGRIAVEVAAERGRLLVTIADDGRGVDWDEVRHEAERRGERGETSVDPASPQLLARLLFQPGFSTSPTVTRLSGRGMGLSVVASAMTRLQGDVQILPGEPVGTKFVLSVPLSSTRRRVLLVECGGQPFGLPGHHVERLARISPSDVKAVEGKTTVEIDGAPLGLRGLAEILGLSESADSRAKPFPAVVLRSGPARGAVAVTEILGEMESMIKDLGPLFRSSSLFTGGVLLPDGTPSLLLNPAELLSAFARGEMTPEVRAEPRATSERRRTILVVDDSITTRTLERSILEARGFRVRVAVDGVDALENLRSENFDLVIADIEMPRMDGFGLLAEMKNDSRLKDIPVIIVTSVESRREQERGLALGADAYIVKRRFDQEELLEAIGQIF